MSPTKTVLATAMLRCVYPSPTMGGRHIVLVDDVASTGRTLEAACRELKPYKPASISVMVTHALFVGDAVEKIKLAGANNIWSCDSVTHSTNRIELAKCLAQGICQ